MPIINFLKKIFFPIIIFIFLGSCDPGGDSTFAPNLDELQKFDPIDKGVRFPYYDNIGQDFNGDNKVDDGDKHIRWGRKNTNWHHACASESIQYSMAGKILSIMPISLKASLHLINIATAGTVDMLGILHKIFASQDGFSDYYWDLFNPSCSVIALAQGAALYLAKHTVNFACKAAPAYPKKKVAQETGKGLVAKAKSAATSTAKEALGLENALDFFYANSYCKSSIGFAKVTSLAAGLACSANVAGGSAAAACLAKTKIATKAYNNSLSCCAAVAAYDIAFAAAMKALELKYTAATRHQKKVAICGHDWYGWKEREDTGRMIRGPYHSNAPDDMKYKYYSYYKTLLDMDAKNTLERNINNQLYREFYFGGREIADPTPESNGGCLMPKIDEGKLKNLFGYNSKYNADGKDEIRQRYYFKGSNTEPNFACERFNPDNKKLSADEVVKFSEAYNCCNNRSKNTICLEYISDYSAKFERGGRKYDGLVQPYINQLNSNNISIVRKEAADDYNDAAKEANNPMRDNIDFCEIGSSNCSLGDFLDMPVLYKAYKHPLNDKYVCARSYSVCPYNFTVGTGTFMTGTDIDHQDDASLELLSNIGIGFASGKNRQRNANGYSDCQHLNHCSIIPGDRQDIDYGVLHDKDSYFISSACVDGRGDSQNYHFQNNLLSTVIEMKSITAPLAQCFVETFENLLLNKYGRDAGDNSYRKGDARRLPAFFDVLQGNLQEILRVIMICALMLIGYRILLAGGIEKKEVMTFILKLAFVMYFVSGNAWKAVFSEGLIAVSTELSSSLIMIDKDDINIYPNQSELDQLKVTIIDGGVSDKVIKITMDNDLQIDGPSEINKPNEAGITTANNNGTIDLFQLKSKPENGYYFKRDSGIYNISNNHICKFPRYNAKKDGVDTPSYPIGNEYLKVFDTLDCMIGYSLGISAISNGSSFIGAVTMSFLNGFIGMAFAIASLFFAFSLLSVAIKTLSIFVMCLIYLSMLIYVSPITITCILFGRTKDIFNAWFSALVSYSIQPALIFIFAGLFISIFNHTIVKEDVRFEYQITNQNSQAITTNERLPFINCNDWKLDNKVSKPSKTSVYCFFNEIYNPNGNRSESVLTGFQVLGMNFYRVGEILAGGSKDIVTNSSEKTKFTNMLQIAVILYIINAITSTIPNVIVYILSGAQIGSVGGLNISPAGLSQKAKSYASTTKDVAKGLATRHGKQLHDKVTRKKPGEGKADKPDNKGSA